MKQKSYLEQPSQPPFLQQQSLSKQKQFTLIPNNSNKQIVLTSNFQSGNLAKCELAEASTLHIKLWVGGDTNSPSYRSWFYFGIQGISINQTVTFTVMNMSNQVKLFKEGHLPVVRVGKQGRWQRIKISLQQNSVVKSEAGYQVTFKHHFIDKEMHYFAFTFPWECQQNDIFISQLIKKLKQSGEGEHYYCEYEQLCKTYSNNSVKFLTLTYKNKNQQLQVIKLDESEESCSKLTKKEIVSFSNKEGIFISARVHPGETAASHTMNGILKQLFTSPRNDIVALLKKFVIYIVPILNPDGVSLGNFRTDTLGVNLNRYYSDPSEKEQPQIFYLKKLLSTMINKKKIDFCLDLHGHVNKQGAFIYGNSVSDLRKQTEILLFPKILEFNSQIFDFDACNFSESNMGKFTKKKKEGETEGKKDENDKEGSARVTIFKQTGLHRCWTLQCNYNSAKFINLRPPIAQQNKNSHLSHGLICSKISPDIKQEQKLFNLEDFEQLGKSIIESILDYYEMKQLSAVFGRKVKNIQNLRVNVGIVALRLLPFRFDSNCHKMLINANGQMQLKQTINKIWGMVNKGPKASQIKMMPKKIETKRNSKPNNIIPQNLPPKIAILPKQENKEEKKFNYKKENSLRSKVTYFETFEQKNQSQKIADKQKTEGLQAYKQVQENRKKLAKDNSKPLYQAKILNEPREIKERHSVKNKTQEEMKKIPRKQIVKLPCTSSNKGSRSRSLFKQEEKKKCNYSEKSIKEQKKGKKYNIKIMLEKQSKLLKRIMLED